MLSSPTNMDPLSLGFLKMNKRGKFQPSSDEGMRKSKIKRIHRIFKNQLLCTFILCFLVIACQPQPIPPVDLIDVTSVSELSATTEVEDIQQTPFPTRPIYSPGELVDYIAQVGDTLPAVATHFNTSIEEIRDANPFIPLDVTTLPPGMPMQIPIYYEPFWGSPYQIIPDSRFINGPAQIEFNTEEYVEKRSGWINGFSEYAAGKTRTGAQIVDYVAQNFSISPQLLLAILDYQAQAIYQHIFPTTVDQEYILGYEDSFHKGVYLQLVWAADLLNHGYYSWRKGSLESLEFSDGSIENIDPWQNAATVALKNYFSITLSKDDYLIAIGPNGFAKDFEGLFGNPWLDVRPHIPGSLIQPDMRLPFEAGKTWAYTGGPHTGWGTREPWSAVDFAPPATIGGCNPSSEWNTAVADGVVARVGEGVLELDLDGDGDTRTGWILFYLHIATQDKAQVGQVLSAGQRLGHPSCEGGTSTGTHIHIARKYNGEWIPAGGSMPFNLEGWVVHNGDEEYQGTLTRFSQTIVANQNAVKDNYITSKILEE